MTGEGSAVLSSTSRTEAFSDGVMAIAITLLILEVHVPSEDEVRGAGGAVHALVDQWPSYVSYLATFLTIGVIWLNHHALFTKLATVDRVLQWWNLMLLLFVSFLPFPNAVVAAYLRDGLFSPQARAGTALYAIAFALSTVPWAFTWTHLAQHPEHFEQGYDVAYALRQRRRAWTGIVAYGLAIPVAYLVPVGALILFTATAGFYALTSEGR